MRCEHLQAYKDLVTELAAMDSIKPHPNVVAFYGAFVEDPTEPILLEEYVDGESLKHFLEVSRGRGEPGKSVFTVWHRRHMAS